MHQINHYELLLLFSSRPRRHQLLHCTVCKQYNEAYQSQPSGPPPSAVVSVSPPWSCWLGPCLMSPTSTPPPYHLLTCLSALFQHMCRGCVELYGVHLSRYVMTDPAVPSMFENISSVQYITSFTLPSHPRVFVASNNMLAYVIALI